MGVSVKDIPVDWYRTSFSENTTPLYWEEGAEEKVDRALAMLQPDGYERILDLACATGVRAMELSRRGFEVIGVEVCPHLLEIAAGEAQLADLELRFHEVDPRYLEFDGEFDIALSLGGGAIGHFDTDEEDARAFRAVARALRPGGRLLMQVPNVLYVEAHLPERIWLSAGQTVELIDQYWNEGTSRIDGSIVSIVNEEFFDGLDPVPFQRRVYSLEELAEVLDAAGMGLVDVFDGNGERCAPSDSQPEIFVEARLR